MVDVRLFSLRMTELQASVALLTLVEQYRRLGMHQQAAEYERIAIRLSEQGHNRSLVSGETKE